MTRPPAVKLSKRILLVNCFGALFYMACLVQWLWALAPFLPSFFELLEAINRPSTPAAAPNPDRYLFGASLPPAVLILIGAIILILVIAATVYTLITIPRAVAKTGHNITASTSKKIVAATPRYKQLPAKQRRQLTARLMLYVKLSLATLPVIVSLLSSAMSAVLPYGVIVLAAATLGCAGLLLLLAQLVASKLLGVSFEKSW